MKKKILVFSFLVFLILVMIPCTPAFYTSEEQSSENKLILGTATICVSVYEYHSDTHDNLPISCNVTIANIPFPFSMIMGRFTAIYLGYRLFKNLKTSYHGKTNIDGYFCLNVTPGTYVIKNDYIEHTVYDVIKITPYLNACYFRSLKEGFRVYADFTYVVK